MFNFFKKNNRKEIKNSDFDIKVPITNPDLKIAFNEFYKNKSDENFINIINGIFKAKFLAITINDEVKSTKNDDGTTTIHEGSLIKFLLFNNEENGAVLPLFTDWSEVDLSIKDRDETYQGLIMPSYEAFNFALSDYDGLVINPGSDGWFLNKNQIQNFLDDFAQK